MIPAVMLEDKNSSEEIEIEPVKNDGIAFKDIEDDFDDFDEIENDDEIEDVEDGEEVKDEAPKGGIADLLKALLGD